MNLKTLRIWILAHFEEIQEWVCVELHPGENLVEFPQSGSLGRCFWNSKKEVRVILEEAIFFKVFHEGEGFKKEGLGQVPQPLRTFSFQGGMKGITLLFFFGCWFFLGYQGWKKFRSLPPVNPPTWSQEIPSLPRVPSFVESLSEKNSLPSKASAPSANFTIRWKEKEKEARKEFLHGRWEKAEEILASLPKSSKGKYKPQIHALLGEIYFARCRKAWGQNRWKEAVVHCEKSVQISKHKKAQVFLQQRDRQAQQLYLEGYVMEFTYPEMAHKRFQEVLEKAPTQSLYRKKAFQKILSQRRRKVD